MSQTTYEKTTWSAGSTALSAENFNHMEKGIEDAHELLANIFDAIYPVGSIYMSAVLDTPTKVMEKFGGTWVSWGQGRVPVGVGTSDRAFAAGETGGSSNAIVPSHDHTATFRGAALGNHTHTFTGTAVSGHTHSVSGSTGAAGSHSHTPGNDSTHVFLRSETGQSIGRRSIKNGTGTEYTQNVYASGAIGTLANTSTVANHSHSVSLTTGTAGAHTPAGTNSNASAGTPAGTVTVAARGESATGKNLQPYITCYMYKRTA
jgi:hypothetical protein